MAITEVYVDPSINANSGAGTLASPYGDLQYALNSKARDATNGDRFNIKAGTDEVLTAALDLTTYGVPTQAAPLVFQGYTAAAGDGGLGGISGAGSYSVFNSATLDEIVFADLHCYNSGANPVIKADANCAVLRCHVHNTTQWGITLGTGARVIGCYVHDCASAISRQHIATAGNSMVAYCYVLNDDGSENAVGISASGNDSVVVGNIVVQTNNATDGANNVGISTGTGDRCLVAGNTVWGSGVMGNAIVASGLSYGNFVINNIVEGFSAGGGLAALARMAIGNAAYNNGAANFSITGESINENNDVLGASPFVDAANGDFRINGTVAGVTEDGYPQSWPGLTTATAPKPDKGAVQSGAGAAGGAPGFRSSRIPALGRR